METNQDEREAFDSFYARKDEMEKAFMTTRDLVRVLSKNDPDLQYRLKFSAIIRLPLGDWIQARVEFYNSLLLETALMEKLVRFNVTADSLNGKIRNWKPSVSWGPGPW